MPLEFQATGQIATGLVDDTKQSSIISDLNVMGDSKVTQKFSNLLERIRMKLTLDQVSYLLILHDLQSPTPFRKNSPLMNTLNPDAIRHAIDVYKQKYRDHEALDLNNPDQAGLNAVIESMGYSVGAINDKLTPYRAGTSDYITIDFTSENPELSAFVVNNVIDEFISYYNREQRNKMNKDVEFLEVTLKAKYDTLKARQDSLQRYKIRNNVLDLETQSATIYQLLVDYETRKSELEREIAADRATIASIDAKFNPRDRQFIEARMSRGSEQTIDLENQRNALARQQVLSNFEDDLQPQIDSLNAEITRVTNSQLDEYITQPLAQKATLVQSKIQLQIQLEQATYSQETVQKRLNELNERYTKLVPHQAIVGALMSDIEMAGQEYMAIMARSNQAGLTAATSTQLTKTQKAVPPPAKPSKSKLLLAISFVASIFFCLVVFFAIFYFDTSIKISSELAHRTGVPVLGHLNILTDSVLDLKKMWTDPDTKERKLFKDMLRSVRFETERELGNNQFLMITSLCRGEGKTVFALSITYAFAMTGKKVLLIDGNFKDNSITRTLQAENFLEDYLRDNNLSILTESGSISVLGNRGGDTSLFELASEQDVKRKIHDLTATFDLIIVEAAALKALNISSEWAVFADKIISVFEAGRKMSPNRKSNINYLMNLDDKFIGWVLNKIPGRYLSPLIDKSWLKRRK
jgi:Mrp family chromosome partitioning ATPase/uncharacterized protein involved in exopolysaccharide biosynthesis